ncbi:hypothetical protein V2J09_007614 [Rumex salicifolius]
MEDERRNQDEKKLKNGGFPSRVKKECLSTFVSLQEGFTYVKAFFVGQGKKLTAKNEDEAAAADLETSKMQVEATDAAERAKNRIR